MYNTFSFHWRTTSNQKPSSQPFPSSCPYGDLSLFKISVILFTIRAPSAAYLTPPTLLANNNGQQLYTVQSLLSVYHPTNLLLSQLTRLTYIQTIKKHERGSKNSPVIDNNNGTVLLKNVGGTCST